MKNIFNQMIRQNGSTDQKKQCDTGMTLISSEKKGQSHFTAKCVFYEKYCAEHPDTNPTNTEIENAWNLANLMEKKACADTAAEWLQQGPFLLSEITKALYCTGASASWAQIATPVSGSGNLEILCQTTICDFVMLLPD